MLSMEKVCMEFEQNSPSINNVIPIFCANKIIEVISRSIFALFFLIGLNALFIQFCIFNKIMDILNATGFHYFEPQVHNCKLTNNCKFIEYFHFFLYII